MSYSDDEVTLREWLRDHRFPADLEHQLRDELEVTDLDTLLACDEDDLKEMCRSLKMSFGVRVKFTKAVRSEKKKRRSGDEVVIIPPDEHAELKKMLQQIDQVNDVLEGELPQLVDSTDATFGEVKTKLDECFARLTKELESFKTELHREVSKRYQTQRHEEDNIVAHYQEHLKELQQVRKKCMANWTHSGLHEAPSGKTPGAELSPIEQIQEAMGRLPQLAKRLNEVKDSFTSQFRALLSFDQFLYQTFRSSLRDNLGMRQYFESQGATAPDLFEFKREFRRGEHVEVEDVGEWVKYVVMKVDKLKHLVTVQRPGSVETRTIDWTIQRVRDPVQEIEFYEESDSPDDSDSDTDLDKPDEEAPASPAPDQVPPPETPSSTVKITAENVEEAKKAILGQLMHIKPKEVTHVSTDFFLLQCKSDVADQVISFVNDTDLGQETRAELCKVVMRVTRVHDTDEHEVLWVQRFILNTLQVINEEFRRRCHTSPQYKRIYNSAQALTSRPNHEQDNGYHMEQTFPFRGSSAAPQSNGRFSPVESDPGHGSGHAGRAQESARRQSVPDREEAEAKISEERCPKCFVGLLQRLTQEVEPMEAMRCPQPNCGYHFCTRCRVLERFHYKLACEDALKCQQEPRRFCSCRNCGTLVTRGDHQLESKHSQCPNRTCRRWVCFVCRASVAEQDVHTHECRQGDE